VESGSRARLDEICPRGWSEVRASSSFLGGLLAWGTLGIYTPTNVTIVCAAPPGVYIGAPGETPLAPPCR
jgi:Bor protein